MMVHGLMVRTCNPHDAGDAAAYERLNPGAVFAHLLSMPVYSVDEDLFFAEMDRAVVGYVNVLPELCIGRVVLDYRISESRWEHILTELFCKALDHARRIGAKVAHLGTRSFDEEQKNFLSSLGFNIDRRYHEMSFVLSEANHNTVELPSSAYRHLQSGEEEVLTQIQNSCFEGSWGYNPNSTEDIAWQFRVKANSPEDIILAIDKGKVIGYCWTVPNCGHDVSSSKSRGRIHMMGIHPDCRSRGMGRRLLEAGLSHLQSNGVELVELTVDSQNVAAIKLYESLGFQCCQETLWYEKPLDKSRMGNQ